MNARQLFALLTLSTFGVAQQLPAMPMRALECPNFEGMITFCSSVANRSRDPQSPHQYLYTTKIMRASCVLPTDTAEEIRAKVQHMWKTFEDQLVCDSNSFNVENGSILKLAVQKKFDAFIDDALETWQVHLNRIDPSDGRTVLDYIAYERNRSVGTPIESTYVRYYTDFRAAGAKHRVELERRD